MAKQKNKKEQENDKTETKKGFGVFIQKTISNTISILIWVLVGSNFMYYANKFTSTAYGGTNIQCPPYNKSGVLSKDCPLSKTKTSQNGGRTRQKGGRTRQKGGTNGKEKAKKTMDFFTDLSEWGWPYNNAMTQNPEANLKKKPEKKEEAGWTARFGAGFDDIVDDITGKEETKKNNVEWNGFKWFVYWITQTIAFSYATGRSMLAKIIPLFNTGEEKGWLNTVGVFGTPLLVVLIVTILAPIIGFATTLWGAIAHPFSIDGFPFLTEWWKIILWIFFLIFLCFTPISPFLLAAGVTGWQHVQLIVFFALLPLFHLQGREYVKTRFKNNWILISCMILLFTTANAWTYLGKDAGLGFLVMTLMVVGYFIFRWAFGSKDET